MSTTRAAGSAWYEADEQPLAEQREPSVAISLYLARFRRIELDAAIVMPLEREEVRPAWTEYRTDWQ
jgi:hypothetical protein